MNSMRSNILLGRLTGIAGVPSVPEGIDNTWKSWFVSAVIGFSCRREFVWGIRPVISGTGETPAIPVRRAFRLSLKESTTNGNYRPHRQ